MFTGLVVGIGIFLRPIEFIPGNRKLFHHMNGEMLRYEFDKKKNVFDGEKVVDVAEFPTVKHAYEKMKLANDDGSYPIMKLSVTNFLPGVLPNLYPEGIGGFFMSRKGAFFFKDIHYGPSPIDTSDQSQLNIFFGPGPLKRPTLELQMGTLGVSPIVPPLIIPPDSVKTFLTSYYVGTSISLLTINPHMHLLGKKFWAFAIAPDGDTIPLIKINKWDFRWQYFYTFKKMVKIPEGSTIYVYGTFDNTSQNPLNPFHPPRTISERDGSMLKFMKQMDAHAGVFIQPIEDDFDYLKFANKENITEIALLRPKQGVSKDVFLKERTAFLKRLDAEPEVLKSYTFKVTGGFKGKDAFLHFTIYKDKPSFDALMKRISEADFVQNFFNSL